MTDKSKSDEWWTPQELFEKYCEIAGIIPLVDFAAKRENAKCHNFLSDSLQSNWVHDGWLNPPNSLLKLFVDKAWKEWKKNNINIICLVPTGIISRRYFRPIWDDFVTGSYIDIIPIDRPYFLYEGEKQKFSARNDYILLIFRRR